MNDWIIVETRSTPWIAGEARYDGAFLTKADAIASLVEDLPGLDAAITSWHASILEPVQVWWTGTIAGGSATGDSWPHEAGPVGSRLVTVAQLVGGYFDQS